MTVLLSGCENDVDVDPPSVAPKAQCAATKKAARRFNRLDATLQERDTKSLALFDRLSDPVELRVTDSFHNPKRSSASRGATIRLVSEGCEILVLAKSPMVEVQVIGE